MDVEQIEAIEKRAKAAAPGPWMRNGKTAAGWRIDNGDPNRVGIAFILTPTAIVLWDADADFIAHAREDVPALIDEVLRLRREVGGYEGAVERLQGENAELRRERDQARAELANAADVAERDGLEFAELRRVVNAARVVVDVVTGGPELASLKASIDRLSPTSARCLEIERARALVVETAKAYDSSRAWTDAAVQPLADLLNAIVDLKALEADANG